MTERIDLHIMQIISFSIMVIELPIGLRPVDVFVTSVNLQLCISTIFLASVGVCVWVGGVLFRLSQS